MTEDKATPAPEAKKVDALGKNVDGFREMTEAQLDCISGGFSFVKRMDKASPTL